MSLRSYVFYGCSSGDKGGGIFFTTLINVLSNSTLLSYCFFHGNTETNGKDIYSTNNELNRVYHSLSTNGLTQRNVDDWLMNVTDPFNQIVNEVHVDGFDSFGCGIHSCYPCSTIEWATNHPLPDASVSVVNEDIRRHTPGYCYPVTFFIDSVVFVGDEGEDEEWCGSIALSCKSLTYSSYFNSSAAKEMKLLSSSILNETLSTAVTATIESNTSIKQTIYIEESFSNQLCVLNAGTLTCSKLTFATINSTPSEISVMFFLFFFFNA
jgi:hypothetical protein